MSIKLSDLRLGNWVTLDRDKPFKITCSSFALFERLNIEVSDYLPIPLTPEILIKAGFENLHTEYCESFQKEPLLIEWLPDSTWMIRLELKIKSYAFVLTRDCYYVHELQNLWQSITGKEIELNTLSI